MGHVWHVKEYNRNYKQYFNVKEPDGSTAKNLSGYTVTLKVARGSTLLISGSCTVASATTGYVYYTVASGAFPYRGRYNFELECVRGNELIETETYHVQVERSL